MACILFSFVHLDATVEMASLEFTVLSDPATAQVGHLGSFVVMEFVLTRRPVPARLLASVNK